VERRGRVRSQRSPNNHLGSCQIAALAGQVEAINTAMVTRVHIVGDTVNAEAYQNSGAALNFAGLSTGGDGNNYCQMFFLRIT